MPKASGSPRPTSEHLRLSFFPGRTSDAERLFTSAGFGFASHVLAPQVHDGTLGFC
jgi:hypothetical protein